MTAAAQFVQFAGVGAIGFVVDAAYLPRTDRLVRRLDNPYCRTRKVSATRPPSATTWALNRRVTFPASRSRRGCAQRDCATRWLHRSSG